MNDAPTLGVVRAAIAAALSGSWKKEMGQPTARELGRPYHAGSVYGAPQRPLTADAKRVFREKARRFGHIFGAFGSSVMRVLDALARCLGEDGRCDPSHATLARLTGVAERTVRRALRRARAAGVVSWTRRIVRTRLGARQTSNAYVLHPEAILPEPAGQRGRVTKKEDYQELKQKEQVERVATQVAATGWRGTIEQARAALLTRQRQIEYGLRNIVQMKAATIRSG